MKKIVYHILIAVVAWWSIGLGCKQPYYIQQHSYQQYTIAENGKKDTSLLNMLAPYKRGVDTQMNMVIGTTDEPLTKAQPESTIGNFIADAQLYAAKKMNNKVDAAVVGYGGIPDSLYSARQHNSWNYVRTDAV